MYRHHLVLAIISTPLLSGLLFFNARLPIFLNVAAISPVLDGSPLYWFFVTQVNLHSSTFVDPLSLLDGVQCQTIDAAASL